MTINNFIKSFLIFVFVFIFTATFTAKVNASVIKISDDQKALFGIWQLKKSVSEIKRQNKNNILPAVFAPESIIIAAENDSDEITINEAFSDFIQTNTLPTNGAIISKNIFQVGKVTAKATWQGSNLIVEVVTENGDKMDEKFELSPNKKQLVVTIQATAKATAKPTKVIRVYEKIADNDDDDNTAQIAITSYPF